MAATTDLTDRDRLASRALTGTSWRPGMTLTFSLNGTRSFSSYNPTVHFPTYDEWSARAPAADAPPPYGWDNWDEGAPVAPDRLADYTTAAERTAFSAALNALKQTLSSRIRGLNVPQDKQYGEARLRRYLAGGDWTDAEVDDERLRDARRAVTRLLNALKRGGDIRLRFDGFPDPSERAWSDLSQYERIRSRFGDLPAELGHSDVADFIAAVNQRRSAAVQQAWEARRADLTARFTDSHQWAGDLGRCRLQAERYLADGHTIEEEA